MMKASKKMNLIAKNLWIHWQVLAKSTLQIMLERKTKKGSGEMKNIIQHYSGHWELKFI